MECSPACNCPPGTHAVEAALHKAALGYLNDQHVVLWGPGYFVLTGNDDVDKVTEERASAVEWMVRLTKSILERVEGMGLQHWPTCKDCGISAPDVKPRGAKEVPRCEECNRKPKVRR